MSDDHAGEWLTWAEAAKVLGIKPESVQRRARSRRWPRRTGNDGLARVKVPKTAIPDVREDRRPDVRPDESGLLIRAIEAEARASAAEKMLENMQHERDRWRDMAERLSHRETARPAAGLIARLFGRGRIG